MTISAGVGKNIFAVNLIIISGIINPKGITNIIYTDYNSINHKYKYIYYLDASKYLKEYPVQLWLENNGNRVDASNQ